MNVALPRFEKTFQGVERSRRDVAAAAPEFLNGVDKHAGVPHLGERGGRVAQRLVFSPVKAVAHFIANQTQNRANALESFAHVMDGFVGGGTQTAQIAKRLVELPPDNPPHVLLKWLSGLESECTTVRAGFSWAQGRTGRRGPLFRNCCQSPVFVRRRPAFPVPSLASVGAPPRVVRFVDVGRF
jgi:hypothetical protein